MRISECLVDDEIFTHIDNSEGGDGGVRHINASAMWRALPHFSSLGKVDKYRTHLDPEFVKFIRSNRGVERRKLDRLGPEHLALPVLGIWWSDGSCLTVDGHHRIVRRHELGETWYDIYIFNNSLLDRFCVEGMDKGLEQEVVRSTLAQEEGPIKHIRRVRV